MPSASAPWVLPFAGWLWPCGPERVEVAVRPRGGLRSRARDAGLGLSLWVDPTLPAPSVDEGPLGCEARLLRAAAPPAAVETSGRGPRPPRPGADAAREVALLAALQAAFGADPAGCPFGGPESPERAAARLGRPVRLDGSGAPDEPGADLLALLDARLLLYQDLVSRLRGEPRAPDEPPVPLRELPAWLDAAEGRGLGAPTRSPRATRLEAALRESGMIARWPLGEGVVLVLCQPAARPALSLALADHGLHVLPCELSGVRGVTVDPASEEVA